MSVLRIFTLLLAVFLASPCFFSGSASAFISPDTTIPLKTKTQVESEKRRLREALDAESARAYGGGEAPSPSQENDAARKLKYGDILIHSGEQQ